MPQIYFCTTGGLGGSLISGSTTFFFGSPDIILARSVDP